MRDYDKRLGKLEVRVQRENEKPWRIVYASEHTQEEIDALREQYQLLVIVAPGGESHAD